MWFGYVEIYGVNWIKKIYNLICFFFQGTWVVILVYIFSNKNIKFFLFFESFLFIFLQWFKSDRWKFYFHFFVMTIILVGCYFDEAEVLQKQFYCLITFLFDSGEIMQYFLNVKQE